jgi:hypothetical protein
MKVMEDFILNLWKILIGHNHKSAGLNISSVDIYK